MNPDSIKVIIIEDEGALRSSIVSFLTATGLEVRGVRDGLSFDLLWEEWRADIVVLDVGLPGEDGFSIASRLQTDDAPGIIMLTARSSSTDHMDGLIAGADTYLVKPLDLRVLEATIRNLARRVNKTLPRIEEGSWAFDVPGWALIAPTGQHISLTTAEFGLISALSENPGQPVRRQDILQTVNQQNMGDVARNLEVLITRLRRKVKEEAHIDLPVRSVRSVGYVFHSPLERRGVQTP